MTCNRRPAADYTAEELRQFLERSREDLQMALSIMARRFQAPLLLGMDTLVYGPGQVDRYNSAVLVNREGAAVDRYDKMRPVMFGEYVPLAYYWPWLYRLTPLADGLDPGEAPKSLSVGDVRIAPNICFETLLPHFIRGQVATLRAEGAEPDLLVNLTNDGWFWGSSELDLHLMCGVFRAVECRKPLVIAANTGFSAVIDADGRGSARGDGETPTCWFTTYSSIAAPARTWPWGLGRGSCLCSPCPWGSWGAGVADPLYRRTMRHLTHARACQAFVAGGGQAIRAPMLPKSPRNPPTAGS